jgi:1-acyl-sn-glycerol-3-phosphate acyltransferase
MVVRASKWRGAQFCSRVADAVSAIWGARVVQLASAGLSVEGLQKLNSVSGRTIFVCNHKSFVDFAIIPVALGLINLERKIGFKLRFMAARDHFFDNQFLYRIVGIGKAMEKVGTIFVDRKSKNKKATEAVSEAAASMIEEGLDIVMYPQGTRAFGNKDKRGQRLDAGYYTTGSERNLLKNRGHLKKGVAYLAADVAASLAKRGQELNIVPIGLVGTGTIVPRGKIRIQKGVAMKVIIGDPIVVGPQACEGDRAELVESLLDMIDARLKEVLRIHEGLKKRLLLDVRGMMREGDIDRFLEALRAWRDDEDLIFSIIDCIYSLPAKLWRSYFRRLANLLGEMDTSREKLIEFKGIVVAEMVKHR